MKTNNKGIKMRSSIAGSLIAMSLVMAPNVSAAVVTILASGSFISVGGSYSGVMYVGQGYTSTFTFDTNSANASHYTLIPSTNPNDDYTAAYTFSGGPYGMSATENGASDSFATSQVEIRVSDNVFLSAGAGAGLIQTDGYYDVVDIKGNQGTGHCTLPQGCSQPYEFDVLNAEQVGLTLFGNSSWFSGGALPTIPNNSSARLWAATVVNGVDTGNIVGSVNSFTVSAVPVPAAAWLLGSGLFALIGVARRKTP